MTLPTTKPWLTVDPEHMTAQDVFLVWNRPEFWESQGFDIVVSRVGAIRLYTPALRHSRANPKFVCGQGGLLSKQAHLLRQRVVWGVEAGLTFREAVIGALVAEKL